MSALGTPELAPVVAGLREVVAGELVELLGAIGERGLEVLGEPLVQVGSARLRERGIGGVTEQLVLELVRRRTPFVPGRDDDLSVEQAIDDVTGVPSLQQHGELVPGERLADDGRRDERLSLLRRQPVQASGEQAGQGRRGGG